VFYGQTSRLLKDNGIYILETMNTGPLSLKGARVSCRAGTRPLDQRHVQAMINPVALY